ncbi:MAG: hypothetical protein ACI9FR_002639 [Cryomorphaceae bacterium]|jgi:uncharacterized protein (DUF1499 family)
MSKAQKLGVTNGKLAELPGSPNAVSSQTGQSSKQVEALPLKGSVVETKGIIIDCLSKMGGNKITVQTDDYIHAVFTSRLFRFKDDVEFYIDAISGQVHFRSGSRVGYSDMGANRKRYQGFRELYQ